MKWLWRYVWNRMREIGNEPQTIKEASIAVRDTTWHDNLVINLTNATGGTIVTFRRYDHKTDRTSNQIYVIPDDLDFNAELGKLITLESMRM